MISYNIVSQIANSQLNQLILVSALFLKVYYILIYVQQSTVITPLHSIENKEVLLIYGYDNILCHITLTGVGFVSFYFIAHHVYSLVAML